MSLVRLQRKSNASQASKSLIKPTVQALSKLNQVVKDGKVVLTDKQKAQFVATVMSEVFQGNASQRDVGWIYLNLIKENKSFESGMNKSSAFKKKSDNYKVYMVALGYGADYKSDAPSDGKSWMTVPDSGGKSKKATSINDYVENNGYFKSVSLPKLKAMKTFMHNTVLGKQDSNPYKGWTGQGDYQDLNNRSKEDHWDQVRHYYVLSVEKKVRGTYIKVLGSGKKAVFIFNRKKILQYFKDNPKKMPSDRKTIKKIDGTTIVN